LADQILNIRSCGIRNSSKLLVCLLLISLSQACKNEITNEEENQQNSEIKWLGLRANFYESDSLNAVRRELLEPTIFYDLMCANRSNDTICIGVNAVDDEIYEEDKLYAEVLIDDSVKHIRVDGYLSPDEVCILPDSTMYFSFASLLDDKTLQSVDKYGYSKLLFLISDQEALFYNNGEKIMPIEKDSTFQVTFRDPTDTSVE